MSLFMDQAILHEMIVPVNMKWYNFFYYQEYGIIFERNIPWWFKNGTEYHS